MHISLTEKIKGMILRSRDLVIDGESQITTTFKDEIIKDKLEKIVEKLHLYGHVVLQAIISSDNELKIIECNPRFGGASTVSIKAGLDSFYWFYLESMGTNLNSVHFIQESSSIKQVRVKEDMYIW